MPSDRRQELVDVEAYRERYAFAPAWFRARLEAAGVGVVVDGPRMLARAGQLARAVGRWLPPAGYVLSKEANRLANGRDVTYHVRQGHVRVWRQEPGVAWGRCSTWYNAEDCRKLGAEPVRVRPASGAPPKWGGAPQLVPVLGGARREDPERDLTTLEGLRVRREELVRRYCRGRRVRP